MHLLGLGRWPAVNLSDPHGPLPNPRSTWDAWPWRAIWSLQLGQMVKNLVSVTIKVGPYLAGPSHKEHIMYFLSLFSWMGLRANTELETPNEDTSTLIDSLSRTWTLLQGMLQTWNYTGPGLNPGCQNSLWNLALEKQDIPHMGSVWQKNWSLAASHPTSNICCSPLKN